MNNILENSLVMVVLIAIILIPVYWIKHRTNNQKKAYLTKALAEISEAHDFTMVEQDILNNLLLATDSRRLLLFNTLDHSHKFCDLQEIAGVEEKDSAANIKTIALLVRKKDGSQFNVEFYKQYTDSESSFNKAKNLSEKWRKILQPTKSI